MKIADLAILTALFQEPNLTKISRRFHLSQSSLSKILRRIEDELGFPLFVRKGFQGLSLTPQGEVFAKRIQKFHRSWEDTLSLVKNQDQKRSDVKITGPHLYMRNIFLPAWFASGLSDRYRLIYTQSRMNEVTLAAQAGDIDLVITESPFELPQWTPSHIFTEKFAVFGRFTKTAKSLKELDLQNKSWIGYRASNDVLHYFLHDHQIDSSKVIAYIEDIESILNTIQQRANTLALLPAHAASEAHQLKSWLVSDEVGQKLFLMHNTENAVTKSLVRELRSLLKKEATA